jgi:predicted ATPase/DNA-binding SARP family transcriptional activator
VTNPVTHVGLLGPIGVATDSFAVVALPSPSQRRLVAVLALQPGVTMRAAQLCDVLDIKPGALRATISRVRRLVGDEVLRSDALGYRIDAPTDMAMFADLVGEAVVGGGPEVFERALSLWRGPAIDEFADEHWAQAAVARAEELRCVAIEGRAAELIRAGRPGEAVAELTMHVADHPLRDEAQGLLMVALATEGRQADALRSFQDYRRHLAEHLGTVPSPHVRRVEQWVADETSGPLDPRWPTPGRRPSGSANTPFDGSAAPVDAVRSVNNVPLYRSSFVGRRTELLEVLNALGSAPLVTLVGEGGVGKTRLASQVSKQLVRDGRTLWFVELASVKDSAAVVSTIAAQLGASLVNGQEGLEGFIGDRDGVLVIDNCEHLLDAVAAIVDALMGTCAGLVVLATSREALGVQGEQVKRVRPLDPAGDGADLFFARADAAGAELRPDQRDEVESICQRLDGNPLAIELAAPRVAALGLGAIIDGLDDRFTLLSGGRRRGQDRHQTLRSVVQWSDRLLTPHEQAVFRSLGVFSGGFELDGAHRVLTSVGLAGEPVLSTLASLVQQSMVVAEPAVVGSRFRLLDTLRAYALEQLDSNGERLAASAAHAEWIASISDVPLDEWMTPDAHRRSLRLEREVDNWRDAMHYATGSADIILCRRLCGAPMGIFLWGRPDLVDHLDGLENLFGSSTTERDAASDEATWPDRVASAGLAYARWGRAWMSLDLIALTDACDRFDQLMAPDTTGISSTIRSATLLVDGDINAATAIRTAAIDDRTVVAGGRDLSLALAVYGACSAGHSELLADEWLQRIGELARSCEVAAIRKVARVAMSWVLIETDSATSVTWLHEALTDPEPIPAYWDRIIETFVSRFLTRTSPSQAARHLLDVLPAFDASLAAADAVTVVTAAGLLAVCGHPAADDVVATLAAAMTAQYLATVVRDTAERRARGQLLGSDQVITVLRSALEDIAQASGLTADAQL